jgi:hypothetical protein
VSAVTRIKLALAIIGLVVFGAGVRFEDARLRWIGVGFVAVAALMRWVKPKPPAG